jgi:3-oxoacyl-[acyl-carrier protein] reductase
MKNILIVGSNSFIAKNTVDKLQQQSYNCILTSRSSGDPALVLDVENEKSILDFCKLNSTISLDGILFFQGINPSRNVKEMTAEHFMKMLSVNLIGPALLLKHIHKNLNKDAMILFISSVAAQKGSYDPSYAAAKSGMIGLTHTLANEFPDFRFNSISLGLVEDSPVYNNMTPDFRKKHFDRMNGKFIKAGDVSSLISELLENISINKATINIDGGFANHAG